MFLVLLGIGEIWSLPSWRLQPDSGAVPQDLLALLGDNLGISSWCLSRDFKADTCLKKIFEKREMCIYLNKGS